QRLDYAVLVASSRARLLFFPPVRIQPGDWRTFRLSVQAAEKTEPRPLVDHQQVEVAENVPVRAVQRGRWRVGQHRRWDDEYAFIPSRLELLPLIAAYFRSGPLRMKGTLRKDTAAKELQLTAGRK